MKGIILSAGQGRRLLPLTQERPKCLLRISGCTVLEWQLRILAAAGVDRVVVVTGFGAAAVERELADVTPTGMRVRTLFNELYDRADNIVSCARASAEMDEDFLLLNGDTLADPGVVTRLLTSATGPVAVAVAQKHAYDADDMKVRCAGTRVIEIGKNLTPGDTDGEAVGFSLYRGHGPALFAEALAAVLRGRDGTRRWYLSAVNLLAARDHVHRVVIDGTKCAEIDYPDDLPAAQSLVACLAVPRDQIAPTSWTGFDDMAEPQEKRPPRQTLRAGTAG
jgi:L-glutamine-phosphate cytidylyltransferase